MVLGGVGLPGIFALHAVGEVGEHVEGVAAGGEGGTFIGQVLACRDICLEENICRQKGHEFFCGISISLWF